ncbi:MAG: UxaA family hydrolase [Rhodospirillales bacterium]|nr:UxaA family hydrolase [Rhodospirillales bacterium]
MGKPAVQFAGYLRPDGQVGLRNRLLVLSATGLTGPTGRRIAGALPGSVFVSMPYDGGLLGDDRDAQLRTLLGLGLNPNVGAVLLIGGNPPKVAQLAEQMAKSGKPVVALTLDECDHDALTLTDRAIRSGARLMIEISRQRRQPCSLATLFLGLECGRSDPSSGLVANPLLGLMADHIVDAGGKAVFGETTEWLGAEHLLARRGATPAVGKAILDAALDHEQRAIDAGLDLTGDNPGPTNIAGGLTTIEEKSLGNIAKSGSRPIQSLLGYAEAPATPGLHAMKAATYAPESVTGFTAAGANLILFTTGQGNSFVNLISPTIKVSANPDSDKRLLEQLDFSCPDVFTGATSLAEAAPRLLALMIDVASGTRTWGEVLGEGEEVVSRFGASL